MSARSEFYDKGWCRFSNDPVLLEWINHALPAARAAIQAPENAEWLRCDGTWQVGVNALPNDGSGRLEGGPPFTGDALTFIREELAMPAFEWDRAQVSVCYPGYPRIMETESENAFSFRVNRDAAHVDGLRREGEDGCRYLLEHHGFVLGLPLVNASADAAPFVVWEGSHEIIRRGFKVLFDGTQSAAWSNMDVTEAYKAMRREIFATCNRVEVSASPGEAYMTHRLTLHGMAPWGEHATAGPDGRMIAYFRPDFGSAEDWLLAP
jgi:hypothetical protein